MGCADGGGTVVSGQFGLLCRTPSCRPRRKRMRNSKIRDSGRARRGRKTCRRGAAMTGGAVQLTDCWPTLFWMPSSSATYHMKHVYGCRPRPGQSASGCTICCVWQGASRSRWEDIRTRPLLPRGANCPCRHCPGISAGHRDAAGFVRLLVFKDAATTMVIMRP